MAMCSVATRRRRGLPPSPTSLWQGDGDHELVEREVVAPVSARLTHEKARQRAEAAATKVDFFTLVRGED